MIGSYLSIEPVLLQKGIGHLSAAWGFIQSKNHVAAEPVKISVKIWQSKGWLSPLGVIFLQNMHKWVQGSPVLSY